MIKNRKEYKHLVIKPFTEERFDKAKLQEQLSRKHPVSDDFMVSMFLDWWEEREAGVKP